MAVKACHGVGKTFIASRIALAFGSSFCPSKIITTAPTGRLVKELLWAEMRDGHQQSKMALGGEMLTTKWDLGPNWFALGFSPQKGSGSATPTNFQGFHSPHVLVIFDEATGIPPSLWEQTEGILTNKYVRWLAIGNPTDPSSEFEKCFRSRLWRNLTISCFDSPNLSANGFHSIEDLLIEKDYLDSMTQDQQEERLAEYQVTAPAIVTLKWVMERATTWGIDHPLFQSKVLGEFPKESEEQIFKLADIIKAQEREPSKEPIRRRAVGVDPARKGKDATSITVFDGTTQTHRISLQGKENTEVAGYITKLLQSLEPREEELIAVDSTGVGAGVIDILKENHDSGLLRAVPMEVHFGGKPYMEWERPDLQKKKDERYFMFKGRIFGELKDNLKDITLLDHGIYQEELPTIQSRSDSKGRFRVESKDEYRDRTGRKSPDDSDSLSLANFARTITMPTNANRQIRIWRA